MFAINYESRYEYCVKEKEKKSKKYIDLSLVSKVKQKTN